jgi:RHS repeat-associated protein
MYRYDAWGNFQGTAGPGSGEASLAYAGQHWDADLGLSYAQQRWYEPGTGRFLSEDPVFGDSGSPSSLHAFGYANGNPVRFVDPAGEMGKEDMSPGERQAMIEAGRKAERETQARCDGGDQLACESARQDSMKAAIAVGPLAVVMGGVAIAEAVPAAVAAAPAVAAKGTAIVAAAGATANRWGQQASRVGQTVYNAAGAAVARFGDRIAGWAQPAATCVDSVESGSATSCVVAALTHGYQGHVGRSATVPTKTVGAEVEAGAPASTAQTYRVGEVTPNGRIAGLGPGAAASFDATGARTWNEFQAQTRGKFSSRAEAGAAWRAVKAVRQPPVVIGENMSRVQAYASKVSGQTINDFVPSNQWSMQANKSWAQQMRAQGRRIIDVGPDFARRAQRAQQGVPPDARAYNLERMELEGYDGYGSIFERTGKFSGGVPGFDP